MLLLKIISNIAHTRTHSSCPRRFRYWVSLDEEIDTKLLFNWATALGVHSKALPQSCFWVPSTNISPLLFFLHRNFSLSHFLTIWQFVSFSCFLLCGHCIYFWHRVKLLTLHFTASLKSWMILYKNTYMKELPSKTTFNDCGRIMIRHINLKSIFYILYFI